MHFCSIILCFNIDFNNSSSRSLHSNKAAIQNTRITVILGKSFFRRSLAHFHTACHFRIHQVTILLSIQLAHVQHESQNRHRSLHSRVGTVSRLNHTFFRFFMIVPLISMWVVNCLTYFSLREYNRTSQIRISRGGGMEVKVLNRVWFFITNLLNLELRCQI